MQNKTKPSSVNLSVTVLVYAPATQVFDRLTDWPVQSEWMVGTTVRATKQAGRGVGGELSAFTGLKTLGFTDTMIITVWDPPHQISVMHTGRVVKGNGDFIVTAVSGEQSTFTWSEDFIVPYGFLGKLVWPIAKPVVRLGLQISLKKFAHWAAAKTKV
jgi:uncharacterized protein YndB with AHSA1/START domain